MFNIFAGTPGVHETLFLIGLIIMLGTLMGILFTKIKLPDLTGYLVAGLAIGLYMQYVHPELIHDTEVGLQLLSEIALGFIAFQIGSELFYPKLKRSGKEVFIITAAQAIITTSVVVMCVLLFGHELWFALVLGGIASSTAPGPVISIIKRYKSKDKLSKLLIPIVGIDDVFGIILYGSLVSIAVSLRSGADLDTITLIMHPLQEIGGSILVGLLIGFPLAFTINLVHKMKDEEQKEGLFLIETVIIIFISVSLASMLELSPILVPLTVGTVFTNMSNKEIFKTEERVLEHVTPPIMVAFFTIAGLELGAVMNMDLISSIGVIGLVFIVARTFGKIVGAYFGGTIAKTDKKVRKYIGPCLIPEAGMPVGMAIAVASNQAFEIPDSNGMTGFTVKAIVLVSAALSALIGPSIVEYALNKQKSENQKLNK